jgi:DNA-binding winged helix-turn-helix (wHTH) protein/predicted esterase
LLYIFENYSLDLERRELRRGSELVDVEPRVFDLLEYLIRNRNRVVSKDDLIASVWSGRIVSDAALTSRINVLRQALGDSGDEQRLVRTVPRKGLRFVAEVREENRQIGELVADHSTGGSSLQQLPSAGQAVTFCRTTDRVNLAVATAGEGPTLIRTVHWVTNIDVDWNSPITGPLLRRLASKRRLVRYDGRGTGLSDRNVPYVSDATFMLDLEAVVRALELDRFSLLGISGGAATAIQYAVQHPDRVSKLVLFGGYPLGRSKRGAPEEAEALVTMMNRPEYWRAFLSLFMPSGSAEEVNRLLADHQASVSPDVSKKIRLRVDEIDIVDLLPRVRVPTIIFHSRHDNVVPFEQGRLLAASIPNAKFIALESENHALLAREPAWTEFVTEMEKFLGED